MSGARQIADEMIYNLCDNAIKYNRPGGTVCVRLESREEEAVALSVEDTGIGIPQEHQGRVFERFYRVDKKTAPGRSAAPAWACPSSSTERCTTERPCTWTAPPAWGPKSP